MTTWTNDELNKIGNIEDNDPAINDQTDSAYRAKYRRYAGSILNSMVTPEARSATIKLVPR